MGHMGVYSYIYIYINQLGRAPRGSTTHGFSGLGPHDRSLDLLRGAALCGTDAVVASLRVGGSVAGSDVWVIVVIKVREFGGFSTPFHSLFVPPRGDQGSHSGSSETQTYKQGMKQANMQTKQASKPTKQPTTRSWMVSPQLPAALQVLLSICDACDGGCVCQPPLGQKERVPSRSFVSIAGPMSECRL